MISTLISGLLIGTTAAFGGITGQVADAPSASSQAEVIPASSGFYRYVAMGYDEHSALSQAQWGSWDQATTAGFQRWECYENHNVTMIGEGNYFAESWVNCNRYDDPLPPTPTPTSA